MQRRQLLKQIGASSAIAFGVAGAASARESKEIPVSEANYVTVEINGEVRDFTVEEFEQHPETGTLSDGTQDCCYECKECCKACCYDELCCYGQKCGSCPGC
jgi:hypothetical protein